MGLFSYFPGFSCFSSFCGSNTWKEYRSCLNPNAIPPKEQIIKNDAIHIGVDFELGGTIGYIADATKPKVNLINSADQGREVQMSFYAEPVPYKVSTEEYPDGACEDLFRGDWPWNPIGGGDIEGNPSDILEFSKSSTSMHVLSRPKQWACRRVACECTFSKTIEFPMPGQPVVKVTATLNNARTDDYNEAVIRDQELPAMYTNAFIPRLITYNGSNPFTNEPVVEYDASFDNSQIFPWIPGRFPATEHWAAFVNENDWGLGLINPAESVFLGGFSTPDAKGCGGPKDVPTGYIAPVSQHALPRDVTFTYEFYLVVGTVDYIREKATEIEAATRRDRTGDWEHAGTLDQHDMLRHPGLLPQSSVTW